jgi:hypothetical protein
MSVQITFDEADLFAQQLIAAGWHNDGQDCVAELLRLLQLTLTTMTFAMSEDNLVLEYALTVRRQECDRNRLRIGQLEAAMAEHGLGIPAQRESEIASLKTFITASNAVVGGLIFAAAKAEAAASRAPLIYPATLTEPLRQALGLLAGSTAAMAESYRAANYDVPAGAAGAQAFVLDRAIRTVITHGEHWNEVFAAKLRATCDVADFVTLLAAGEETGGPAA